MLFVQTAVLMCLNLVLSSARSNSWFPVLTPGSSKSENIENLSKDNWRIQPNIFDRKIDIHSILILHLYKFNLVY